MYFLYIVGQFALIEMDESHPANDINAGRIVLKNVGGPAGIARSTGNKIFISIYFVLIILTLIFSVQDIGGLISRKFLSADSYSLHFLLLHFLLPLLA
jgi:hypothetical protein